MVDPSLVEDVDVVVGPLDPFWSPLVDDTAELMELDIVVVDAIVVVGPPEPPDDPLDNPPDPLPVDPPDVPLRG